MSGQDIETVLAEHPGPGLIVAVDGPRWRCAGCDHILPIDPDLWLRFDAEAAHRAHLAAQLEPVVAAREAKAVERVVSQVQAALKAPMNQVAFGGVYADAIRAALHPTGADR